MKYNVNVILKVEKQLLDIPSILATKIKSKIKCLGENPRPNGCCKLKGQKDSYRIRVGRYRIVYEIFDNIVLVQVINVDHRKDVYRS